MFIRIKFFLKFEKKKSLKFSRQLFNFSKKLRKYLKNELKKKPHSFFGPLILRLQ